MKHRKLIALILALMLIHSCAPVFSETYSDFVLPQDLKIIDAEAFCGSMMIRRVEIPENTVEIHSRAFADSTLSEIILPQSLEYIADDIFEGCGNVYAFVEPNSYAHRWCMDTGIKYGFKEVTHRALVVANNYPGEKNELFAPDDNAVNMRTMLALQTGTPYEVTIAQNLNADQILSAIGNVFADADINDVSLFYYVGHGANSSASTYLGALCGTGETYVTVSQLREKLDTVAGEKIVLLDSCHSGAYIGRSAGEDTRSSAEVFNDAVIAAFSTKPRGNLATGGYHVLTACSQTQNGYELYSPLNGYGYTLFGCGIIGGSGYDPQTQSQCNMKADRDGNADGATSLIEAYNYAAGFVNDYFDAYNSANHTRFAQNVQYYGENDFVLWSVG